MTVHDNSTIGFIRHPNNVSALQRHSYIFSCEYQPVGTDNGISGPEWVIQPPTLGSIQASLTLGQKLGPFSYFSQAQNTAQLQAIVTGNEDNNQVANETCFHCRFTSFQFGNTESRKGCLIIAGKNLQNYIYICHLPKCIVANLYIYSLTIPWSPDMVYILVVR